MGVGRVGKVGVGGNQTTKPLVWLSVGIPSRHLKVMGLKFHTKILLGFEAPGSSLSTPHFLSPLYRISKHLAAVGL